MGPLTPPVRVSELIPHRGVLLLLETVLAAGPEGVLCSAVVPAAGPLIEGEGIGSWICVELMAQAAAADRGLRARESGEPLGTGLLLGAKDVRFRVPRLESGRRLEAGARLVSEDGPMAAFDCELRDAETGAVLASGSLRVMGSDGTGS